MVRIERAASSTAFGRAAVQQQSIDRGANNDAGRRDCEEPREASFAGAVALHE
jgi:hypothetical protein